MEFKYWETMAVLETGGSLEEETLEPAVINGIEAVEAQEAAEIQEFEDKQEIVEENQDQPVEADSEKDGGAFESHWDAKRVILLIALKIPFAYPLISLGLIGLVCFNLFFFVLSLLFVSAGLLSIVGAVGVLVGIFGPLIGVSFAPFLLAGIAILFFGAACLFCSAALAVGFLLIPRLFKLLLKTGSLYGRII